LKNSTRLLIDADACPKALKEVLYRISGRLNLPILLVANSQQQVPLNPLVTFVKVDKGADMADHYIVENVTPEDIVITADIPLAAFIVEKNAIALDHRGELYTEENVRERLSIRDFMKDIRDSGVITGGPAPFGPKDVEKFTNSLNKILTRKKLS
jgi:uncharacterized protein YaiI (UPF0178 family)